MLDLERLVAAMGAVDVVGRAPLDVQELAYSTDGVGPGTLFFCVPGARADGHDFAGEAVAKGAVALVVERPLEVSVPQVVVSDSRAAMAPAADVFFGQPSHELEVVGVTGTNGKTTTTFLVYAILAAAGRRPGLVGTIEARVGGERRGVKRTTPEAIDLQRLFREMLDAGDRSVAMEASSHAAALHRLDHVRFAALVFTNLSHEHLDFHADMEDYFQAKRRLFLDGAPAAVNVGDEYGRRLAEELPECADVRPFRRRRCRPRGARTCRAEAARAGSTSRTRSAPSRQHGCSASTTTRSRAGSSRCAAFRAASSRSTRGSRST